MDSHCPSNVCLEVCIASLDDAVAAAAAGADRLELNAALPLGGLTPGVGLLRLVKRAVSLPVIAMVRPRPGGFAYNENELATMLEEAAMLLAEGADGVAFGILTRDGRIDQARCRRMMSLLEGRQAVFHRAFDVTPDPLEALEQLIDLGVTRILTSGQAASAIEGAGTIARLIDKAAGRIEILPAAGINGGNVQAILRATGCKQVHASLRGHATDSSTNARPGIRFSADLNEPEHRHEMTDREKVEAMRKVLAGQMG